MNAFTQKPDLSKFIKEANHSHKTSRSGAKRAQDLGGQPVHGMGTADRSKVAIKPNAPRP